MKPIYAFEKYIEKNQCAHILSNILLLQIIICIIFQSRGKPAWSHYET